MRGSKSRNHNREYVSAWLLGLLLGWLWLPVSLPACGPFFPNMFLTGGDEQLLIAPLARFGEVLQQMKLPPADFRSQPPTNSYIQQTTAAPSPATPSDPRFTTANNYIQQTKDADLQDLRAALSKLPSLTEPADIIMTRYQVARDGLEKYSVALDEWQSARQAYNAPTNPPPRPRLQAPTNVQGVPPEFADYYRGAYAWHSGNTNEARQAWTGLLQRAATERRYKSTWAAFMLGKSWETENPATAAACFQQVRALAAAGFADSLGLAAASRGWEARLALRNEQYEAALEMYLTQMASGDPTAVNSLRVTAARAMANPRVPLDQLATNPRCRQVLTAYLLSGELFLEDGEANDSTNSLKRTKKSSAVVWLETVERVNVREVEAAEQFALAAYKYGEMDQAKRWVARAPKSLLAQWVQAKLLMRAGQLDAATTLLSKLSHRFPLLASETDAVPKTNLFQALYVPIVPAMDSTDAAHQILGELGTLQLARHEYVQALDALLRGDFWPDAAYVAERVLTVDELRRYVDKHPETGAIPPVNLRQSNSTDIHDPLRYLLGRRLVRLHRGAEAGRYLPADQQAGLKVLMDGWAAEKNTSLPPAKKASLLWAAAKVARHQGMELMGTELGPDWADMDGDYTDYGPTLNDRTQPSLIAASPDELKRAKEHKATPELRFHYRYTAADLAWQAAALTPDNSDETARVLALAGTWLKDRDPKAADRFYKALVRRCHKTVLGQAADKRRWFPPLDDEGNLLPPPAKSTEPGTAK